MLLPGYDDVVLPCPARIAQRRHGGGRAGDKGLGKESGGMSVFSYFAVALERNAMMPSRPKLMNLSFYLALITDVLF